MKMFFKFYFFLPFFNFIMNKNNISKLADILKKDTYVEFAYNNLFYEIFESTNGGLLAEP